jgi:hypothetical protein
VHVHERILAVFSAAMAAWHWSCSMPTGSIRRRWGHASGRRLIAPSANGCALTVQCCARVAPAAPFHQHSQCIALVRWTLSAQDRLADTLCRAELGPVRAMLQPAIVCCNML